jgi:hypothetical protein
VGTELPRVNILGVGISAINLQNAIDAVEGWIARWSDTTSTSAPYRR